MKANVARALACLLAVAVAPLPVLAQSNPPAQEQSAPLFAPEQLDQLLAPIALYPDQLLGQILMASTYPLEVVQADRWLKDSRNAGLTGQQLADALNTVDWDPSVKALVPFPQLLAMMDQRIDWTQKLGDAFLAQQPDVMDSVQRLRQEAREAGNLVSTPQQTVTPAGDIIVIEPANPQVVYVPVYNPVVVYGRWRYPAYPPYYFPPPAGFYSGPPVASGVRFSIGFTVISLLWGWDDCDWRNRRVHIDHVRYDVIDHYFIAEHRRPALERDVWVHDSYHRRGVVYRDPPTRQRFQAAAVARPAPRSDYRGFDNRSAPRATAPRAAVRPNAAPAATTPRGPNATAGRTPAPATTTPRTTAPAATTAPRAPSVAASRAPAPATVNPPAATTPKPAPNRKPEVARRPANAVPQTTTRPQVTHAPPPAFESFGRGPEVRTQSERGRASLQAGTPSRQAPSNAAPREAPKPRAAPAAGAPAKSAAPAAQDHGQRRPADKNDKP